MAKNTLFDPTTQMAYMPLDEESRIKGKAAIDVIGSASSRWRSRAAVLSSASIVKPPPLLSLLCFRSIAAWLFAENRLSSLYEAKPEQHQKNRVNLKEDWVNNQFDYDKLNA